MTSLKIIEADNLMSEEHKSIHEMTANETTSTCDQYSLLFFQGEVSAVSGVYWGSLNGRKMSVI
jgi:hypothetical protein